MRYMHAYIQQPMRVRTA